MALAIPAVASPVGVNNKIIDHGCNGFLCATKAEWLDALETLLQDKNLRKSMGNKGRQKINADYSLIAQEEGFLSLFI